VGDVVTGYVDRVRHGEVLQLILDAPQRRNALTRSMLSALAGAMRDMDTTVTGVVISGRGETFSAGADFGELTGTSADESHDDAVAAVTQTIRTLPRVVVAAIEGPCVGAAADLALSCDLRVAAEGSYLQIPAVRLGLLYNPKVIDRLCRSFPGDAVRRLLLLGERMSAEEAFAADVVGHLAPRGEALKRALALLGDIDAAHLDAVAATKAVLNDDAAGEDTTWQQRRRELLDSPARRAAVEQAQRRHIRKDIRDRESHEHR
jgi:enoyl-CoA hydratase